MSFELFKFLSLAWLLLLFVAFITCIIVTNHQIKTLLMLFQSTFEATSREIIAALYRRKNQADKSGAENQVEEKNGKSA